MGRIMKTIFGKSGLVAAGDTRTCRWQHRCAHFTLMELLVSMAVLFILMMVAFKLLSSAEQVWRSTERLSDVYENGRIILEVLSRDLQSAVASADTGKGAIRFHQAADDKLWFVRLGGGNDGATSDYVEVAYKLDNNKFMRAFRDDINFSWNVYGARTALGAGDYNVIGERAVRMQITCYDANFHPWPVPSTAALESRLPAAVQINVLLLDEKTFTLWQQFPAANTPPAPNCKRTDLERKWGRNFTKMVYLGQRQ